MTPERWQQIEQLYHAALAQQPTERAAFLVAACAGDHELRREVESLLHAHEQAATFISAPPDDIAAGVFATQQTQVMPGRTLGHYQIRALLGAGGMGEVYRAWDTRLDREVAIKILPAHLAAHPEAIHRFEREAKAVATLSHSNILAIHDFGTQDGISYAVMELLEGETLRDRVQREAMKWREAVQIGSAIADGLAAAHAKGIIHRDLKPENIFLTTDGQIKILDFGIARVKHLIASEDSTLTWKTKTTKPGTVLGTVAYMSPEQVRGEAVETSSDIFSLGCVLYEMLTRQRPFARATAAETMTAILRDEPPPLTPTKVPVALEHLLHHCLEKKPGDRFQSARDLAFDLKGLIGTGTYSTRLPRSRLRLRPRVWIAAAGLVLLTGLAALLFLTNWRGQTIDSLAIMPLVNASQDANTEYLSDGISEDLINHLAQLPNLRVTARSTVIRYKGKEIDPRQVGNELRVSAVFTGRVTLRNDQVFIVVELVKTTDGSQLWGEQYRRQMSDLLAVQEEIAQQISWNLRLTLTDPEKKQLAKRYTQSIDAYQLYLKGRYHWNQRTPEGLQQSITYFQQAIDKDPLYALAYSGLADAYFLLGPLGMGILPAQESVHKQRAAARKALEIDAELAEGHTSLAVVSLTNDWNWREAERSFQRAIALKPSYAVAHSWYAACLTTQGRFEDSIIEIERAQTLDPFSMGISNTVASLYYLAGHYEQAITQYRKTMAMNPQHFVPHADISQVYEEQGKFNEAIAELEQAIKLSERSPEVLGTLGHVYGRAGRRQEAEKILGELQTLLKQGTASPFDLALVYAGLENKDQAFSWLDKALAERAPAMIYVKVDQRFKPLRTDPRFAELLRRIGFP